MARNSIIGNRKEAAPPSAYVQNRNAQLDAAKADHEQFIRANEQRRTEFARVSKEIAQRRLEITEEELKIRQQTIANQQEATLHKLNMEALQKALEGKFLAELNQLDPTKASSLKPALALMAKYHVTDYSASTQEAVQTFNKHLNEAVHQEYVKAEADKAKAEAAKAKKVEGLRKLLDDHKAGFDGAIKAADSYREAHPGESLSPEISRSLAVHSSQIENIGKRLMEADPETAPEVEGANASVKTYRDLSQRDELVKTHAKLEADLMVGKTKKEGIPDPVKIRALNAVKAKLGWGELDESGKLKPESATAPVADTKTPPAAHPGSVAPASLVTTSSAPAAGGVPETAAAAPIGNTLKQLGVSGGDKESSAAPASGKYNPALDPWERDVRPARDAAQAEHFKQLDIATGASAAAQVLNPFDYSLPNALDAASNAGKKAQDLETAYSDDLLALSAATRERSKLARQKADEAMASLHPKEYTQITPPAQAPSVPTPAIVPPKVLSTALVPKVPSATTGPGAFGLTTPGGMPPVSSVPVATAVTPALAPVAAVPVSASEAPVVAAVKRPPLEDIFK